ncbi:family 16 glycosylhydrolase [Nocardioides sp. CER19]|uniref:family 16 glycosylhydrolase n=1 Tax=Nocardioides sp. CER19 TaxID=3038538 RepID=UPI00244C27FA|nr:family 16 glycosylhydrolase [Nocardioides sp. CER19]MDH2413496.1 family 16 glycosylhydrolase [Nocardioides sp. CER19]
MLSKHLVIPLTALGVVLGLFTSAIPSAEASCGRPSGCTKFELIHAGSSYGWYPVKHRYEFIGGRKAPKTWHRAGRGKLYQQNGMLTLVAPKGRSAGVRTVWTGVGYREGRWEVRMRTDRESKGNTDYRVVMSLVPESKRQRHCGAQDIDFLDYSPSKAHTANFNIKTLPNRRFAASEALSRKVGHDEWHEFAVEVTKNHISWFIDAHVVRTERRPAALSGKKYTMQAALVPVAGHRMNKTRLQLDWARYWTMKKKSKKSIKAPATTAKHYRQAC